MNQSKLPLLFVTALLTLGMSGCATLAGGDAGARSSEQIIDNENIEREGIRQIKASDPRFASSHLVLVSHKGVLLLAGQVESEDLIPKAQQVVESLVGVDTVHNELTVSGPTSMGARTNDGWLTTKVKASMASHEAIDSDRINVTTVDGVVYLMGSVSHQQADYGVAVAQSIAGIKRIVRIFEYTD